jgi:two-component system nitrogen regulation response regulator GlnG
LAETAIEPQYLGIHNQDPRRAPAMGTLELEPFEGSMSLKEMVRRSTMKVEREIIQQALRRTGGNKAKAARILQIDYKTMHTKAKEYGLISSRPRKLLHETA